MQKQNLWAQTWYRDGHFRDETLTDVIQRTAAAYPEAYLALESEVRPGRITQAELAEQSHRLAGALYAQGIRAGDVVAIQLPSWIESASLCHAAFLLDAIILPITAILGPAELEYILVDSGAKILFIPGQWRKRDYRDMVPQLRASTPVQTIVTLAQETDHDALGWDEFLQSSRAEVPPSSAHPDDIAALIYTSGTTSHPKCVRHTHNTLLSEPRASTAFLGEQVRANYLSPWPFGHIAGMVGYLHFWYHGANVVLVDRWEAQEAATLIQRHQIAMTSGVPWFLQSLLDVAEAHDLDISSLQAYATGATNVPAELIKRCTQRNIFCFRQYGSTEHPTVTSGVPSDPQEKLINTEGRCLPGNRIRVLDDNGKDLPSGVDGEIATVGPERTVGYKDESRNADSFTADGWFLTGDIGHLDPAGYLTITDRKKDIIIRGGENISSREVEECVQAHPAVVEAAAVAMPDARLGEKVCIFVVLQPGAELTLTIIAEHFTAQGMARQKTPERVLVIDALPRNAAGKIQKEVLRRTLVSEP